MSEVINGYRLTEPLKSDNSGFSKWGFARKGRNEYFLKQFLSPVYPMDKSMFSEEIYFSRMAVCKCFEREKERLYTAINHASKGNLVRIEEFFRSDTHYYITMLKVESANVSASDIAALSVENRINLCRITAYAFNSLHSNGVVHGDVKPENILIRRTVAGKYSAKVIDFDCSFMEDSPPDVGADIPCDILYIAPEMFLRMIGESVEVGTKSDIFSLGLLFSLYLCGQLPEYRFGDYDYPYEAVLDGKILMPDSSIPSSMRELIRAMLSRDPEERPSADEIFRVLAPSIPKETVSVKAPKTFKKAGDL